MEVDISKCDTTGRCVMICPRVFKFYPGHRRAVAKMDPVPGEYRADVLKAAEACPQDAITVEEMEAL